MVCFLPGRAKDLSAHLYSVCGDTGASATKYRVSLIGYHYPVHKTLYNTVIAEQICSQMFVELRYKRAVKLVTSLSSKWRSNPCPNGTMFCGRS